MGEGGKDKEAEVGTSLAAQGLRLHTSKAGGVGLIPGQGTRSYTPQLEILCATTKIWCSQINDVNLKS